MKYAIIDFILIGELGHGKIISEIFCIWKQIIKGISTLYKYSNKQFKRFYNIINPGDNNVIEIDYGNAKYNQRVIYQIFEKNIKKISFILTIFYSDIKNKTKIFREILQHQDDDSLKEKEKIIEWAKGLAVINTKKLEQGNLKFNID